MLVRIAGGLGNQMFQYATGEMIRKRTGKKVKYETFSYIRDKKRKVQLNEFEISNLGKTRRISAFLWYVIARFSQAIQMQSSIERRLGILRDESSTEITDTDLAEIKYYVGYWQNIANFDSVKKEIKRQYCCKKKFPLSKEIIDLAESTNSVAIHVRRGDYLQAGNVDIYASCTLEYYERAIEHIKEKVINPVFLVFSNDISWCRLHIESENVFFVDEQYSESDINDFCIMKACKHFIIANSTFSWWASWLADSQDKVVVAPKTWYLDKQMNDDIVNAILKDVTLL